MSKVLRIHVIKARGGADRLPGGTGDDRLLGGPGRDRADGGPGRDTCVAEQCRSC